MHHRKKTTTWKWTKWLTHGSVTNALSKRTFSSKKKKHKNNKKKKLDVFKFHFFIPRILSVITDLFRVEKKQEIQKGPKTGVWRAPRGKVQVCHSSCASQYKNATTRTPLLSTRRVRGRPRPP